MPESHRVAVHVLATQPACPLCGAPSLILCEDGNRVHLMRTVRVAAVAAWSALVAGGVRLQWDQAGVWLRWVAVPSRPHLVFSETLTELPAAGETDERAWARLEIPLSLAVTADVFPPLPPEAVTDRNTYGTPGALPPGPLPLPPL